MAMELPSAAPISEPIGPKVLPKALPTMLPATPRAMLPVSVFAGWMPRKPLDCVVTPGVPSGPEIADGLAEGEEGAAGP